MDTNNNQLNNLVKEYEQYKARNLSLNMARGKPSKEQLDLSMPLLDIKDLTNLENIDLRNYGSLDGLKESKELFASLLEVDPSNVIVWGNASLNIMHFLISTSYSLGLDGSTPWCKLDKVKFITPVPGYDRHFSILEEFGIEMIQVDVTDEGLDIDKVEKLVKEDESIKGMFIVPKYSNPSGVSCSDDVIKRLARLTPKAKDFRIYYDNAYFIHSFDFDNEDKLLNIFTEAKRCGNEDLIFQFVSTSKITFPGAGISAISASTRNLTWIRKRMGISTIGYDKINQIRHVRFLTDKEGVISLMKKHAKILKPKFDLVDKILNEEVADICSWSKPKGGYFICLKVNGIAKEVIARCKECGVILTDAGCAHPLHQDKDNSTIRLAPSFPNLDELELATRIICLSIKIEELSK